MSISKLIADFTKNLRFFLFSHKGYKAITETQKAILLELVLLRYRDSSDPDIQLALDYLKETNDLHQIIPYKQQKSLDDIEVFFDTKAKLPYIEHKGKKLFFPKGYSKESIKGFYRYSMEYEDIIGDGYRTREPHKYQSERFHVQQDAVLIDAGVAEGLFSLEMIDKVKKVYLIECDSSWWKPLQYTFAPWKNKVVFIKKYLSDKDDDINISLQTLLKQEDGENIFIKMDIEGFEVSVLNGAKETLATWGSPLTLSCCTYHRVSDYEIILSCFKDINYTIETSNGYILTSMNDDKGIYTLRHGIIRASNQKH